MPGKNGVNYAGRVLRVRTSAKACPQRPSSVWAGPGVYLARTFDPAFGNAAVASRQPAPKQRPVAEVQYGQ